MFNITGNGQTTKITPTNPEEFKEALNLLWKKAFVENPDFFDIIWANQNLRGSLFDLNSNIAPMQQFENLINTPNSILYSFIKVE